MRSTLTLLLLALATPAFAVDGVLEINQTCAVETGCFAGDGPGFPVAIDRGQPGSYRLTSNLSWGDPDASLIEVRDDHVRIDLNGFTLSGPTSCSGFGSTLSCTPAGSGSGVAVVPADTITGIEVRNGVIRGMARSGIGLGPEARVEDMLVVSNGFIGVEVGRQSHVKNCQVLRNGASGITGFSSHISSNEVAGNKQAGIVVIDGSVISGNVIHGNGSNAINSGSFGTSGGTLIVDNAVAQNGGPASLDATDSYARNNFRGNGAGPQIAGGVNAGGNVCNGLLTCP